jgi:biopolymer transport protein ExbD
MGIAIGGRRGIAADPNVVPLIDILLVLLVIFMIIPHHQTGLDVAVPQPAEPESRTKIEDENVIVVQVLGDGSLKINEEAVSWDRLAPRLEEVYKERARRIAFIKGDAPVEFRTVARVVDVMRQLDLSVGLLTPKLEQSR